ncbi:T3SS (YopN, CesT) and YbjN peptide-binding chaperone 1 [Flexivirga alba]|uniref:TY-Chap central domain-containing protein n=1 Tax=Flexivirga alba TaxID=702742 RepID=A0ABW2AHB9_9MICO
MRKQVKESATTGSSMGPWELFERRMAAYVSTMLDPWNKLQIYVPMAGDTEPWVIDIAPVRGVIQIDYHWDEVYTTADDPADAVHQLRTVLEGGRFRTPHPQLLTVAAIGTAAAGVGILGLGVRGSAPDVDGSAVPALFTSTKEQVLGALLAHVRSEYDEEAELDEDDDLPLMVNGVRLWVGVTEAKPAITFFTRVVDDVRSRRQAGVDVNGLNRSNLWSRWVVRDHSVWQHLTIPSLIFQPELFDEMLALFVADYRANHLDLADRLGGQPATG